MRCHQCGADLRESARFCNRCGARTPGNAAAGDVSDPLGPGAGAPDGRVRRPSRPLRRAGAPGYGVAAPVSRPLARETTVLSGGDPFALPPTRHDTPTGAADTPVGQPTAISDLPTAEYAATPASVTRVPSAPAGPAPWPLPAGMTLLNRFQIVTVAETQPDAPGAANTYHVVDLLGYMRCWSCHTKHGATATGERFCLNCGADMLGHEYLMIERRAGDVEETKPRVNTPGARETGPIDPFTFEGRRYSITDITPEIPLFPMGAHISVAGMSDVGMTRGGDVNEDSFGTLVINLSHDSRQQPLAVAIVADGLGGHANGQEASRLASRIFIERLAQQLALPLVVPMGGSLPPDAAVDAALRDAVNAANAAVYEANVQGAADMGSTLVAAVIVGDHAWIANVGDSRAYVLDADSLRRITSDHSLVEQLIVSGMIEPEERYTHLQRNRIFRSLGSDPTVEVDVFTQKLAPGMRLLLCSDGLWEMTHDPEMERILREKSDPRSACEALIDSANTNGGEDNITAIVLRADA